MLDFVPAKKLVIMLGEGDPLRHQPPNPYWAGLLFPPSPPHTHRSHDFLNRQSNVKNPVCHGAFSGLVCSDDQLWSGAKAPPVSVLGYGPQGFCVKELAVPLKKIKRPFVELNHIHVGMGKQR